MPEQQRYRLYDIMKAPGDELEMLVTDYEAFYEAERETGEEPDREQGVADEDGGSGEADE